MTNPFTPRVGGVLSADIAVPEHERVVRFYARVLGTGETPFWREDLMNDHGLPIIGVGARSPEYADLPLQWMPHIQVEDVAHSVKSALAHGGKELMHAKGEDGRSQWAVLLDPNGAAFGLIPVVSADEAPTLEDEAAARCGRIAWLDLTVTDAAGTREFYREVVGWSVEEVPLQEPGGDGASYADFNMLAGDGSAAAGICHARGVNTGLPPVWMLYLPVGDVAESLRRVREEGGQVLRESKAADGGVTSAVVQDPVGAVLALAAG